MQKFIIGLILFFSINISSQNYNLNSVEIDKAITPTSSVFSLGKYGENSSVDNKGAYNHNINLVTLNSGSIKYNLNLNYSSGNGLKLNEWGGRSGMLWSDNFTSVIYRIVRGIPDDASQKIDNIGANGFSTINEYNTLRNIYELSSSGWAGAGKDAESDIFYYNIFGMSGSFVVVNGEITQLNYNNKIKIEAGIYLNDFIITTGDGTKYFYGQNGNVEEATYNTMCTEETTPLIKIKTAWFLTKIEDVRAKSINFQYNSISSSNIDDYNESFVVKNKLYAGDLVCKGPSGQPAYNEPIFINSFNCTRSKIFDTKVLHKVTSTEFSVDFNYNGREDIMNEKLLSFIEIRNTVGQLVNKIDFSYDKYGNNASLPVHEYGTPVRYYLKFIRTGMNLDIRYDFEYNNPELLPKRFTKGLDLMGFYNGKNNTSILPYEYVQNVYPLLTGGSINPLVIPSGDRSPSPLHSQYGLLKKITFPTKGAEIIEYEQNKINSDTSANIVSEYYGIRTKSIIIKSQSSTDISKSYIYDKYTFDNVNKIIFTNQPSSHYFNALSQFNDQYGGYLAVAINERYVDCSSHLGNPVPGGNSRQELFQYYKINSNSKYDNNAYGNFIAYQNITEIVNNQSFKANVYSIAEEPASINILGDHTNFHPLGNSRWGNNIIGTNYYGLLNNGFFVKKYASHEYQFQLNKIINNYTINRDFVPQFEGIPSLVSNHFRAFSVSKYLLMSQWNNLKKTVQTNILDDGSKIVETTDYTYFDISNYNNLKSRTDSFSDGKSFKNEYSYATDLYSSANNFVQRYMVGIPLRQAKFLNNKVISQNNLVYSQDWIGHEVFLPYQHQSVEINSINTGNPIIQNDLTYDQYDLKGNVLQYTIKDNLPVSIIYGYNQTLPLLKVEGLSAYSLINILGSNITSYNNLDICQKSNADTNAANEQLLLNALGAVRNLLQGYQVTTYTYDPLIGVTSITPPSGIREIYRYDSANRLESIKDVNGKIIKEFQYNYKH